MFTVYKEIFFEVHPYGTLDMFITLFIINIYCLCFYKVVSNQ